MPTVTLKVFCKDEIRRITYDYVRLNLDELEQKIRDMFPQLDTFVLKSKKEDDQWRNLDSTEDLELAVFCSQLRYPPILHLLVAPGEVRNLDITESQTLEETPLIEEEEQDNDIDYACTQCLEPVDQDVHFRCLNCPETLCEACERENLHDSSHLLAKLHFPLYQLPLKHQLVFLEHLEKKADRDATREQRKELKSKLRELAAIKRVKRKERARLRALRKLELASPEVSTFEESPELLESVVEYTPIPEELPSLPDLETRIQELTVPTSILFTAPETLNLSVRDPEPESAEESWSLWDFLPSWAGGEPRNPNLQISGIAFSKKLDALEQMGFHDRQRNILVLVKHLANLETAVAELTEQ